MPKREYCLQEAAAAQAMADRTDDPVTRQRLLRAVDQWKTLAESFTETERRVPFRSEELAAIKAAIVEIDPPKG